MTDCRQRHNNQSGIERGRPVTNGMIPNEGGCLQFIGRLGEYCRGLAPIRATEGRKADRVVLDCTGWLAKKPVLPMKTPEV
jgi:hypothetical protein